MNSIPPVKTCRKCGQSFPATTEYWHRNKTFVDGFAQRCKTCCNASVRSWQEKNREKTREYSRNNYSQTPEKVKAQSKAWRDANPEKVKQQYRKRYTMYSEQIKEQSRLWRESNPEKARENRKRWRQNNPEKAKLSQKLWVYRNREKIHKTDKRYRKNHPDKMRAKSQLRRSRIYLSDQNFTPEDVRIQFHSQKGKCWHCGCLLNDDFHIDHLIPLARGGTNAANNIVCSCPVCNLKKGAKTMMEWKGRLF